MAETRQALGRAIRTLMRGSRWAVLSTGLGHADGWPYGSFVTVAIDQDASPLMLFSGLSDHTRNLAADDRASLLFAAPVRHRNPQRGLRVTIMGRIAKTKRPEHARRFLTMHPEAEMYAGFGDFDFYRMRIDRAHWVGGFAKAQWIRGRDVGPDAKAARALGESAAEICAHMNADHADAVDLYARKLLKRRGAGWRMAGIDPDGADLVRDGRFARLSFAEPIAGPGDARKILIGLAADARRIR
ncbi:MAG: DUF2470 domain-containing protein [Rhodospirillaceae bacterium]